MSDESTKFLYEGFEFNAELEARWAVVFDYLGVPWQYKRESFDLGAGLSYSPSFWLPRHNLFFDVRQNAPTDLDCLKAYLLSAKLKLGIVVASGVMVAYASSSDDFSLRLFAGEAWDAWDPIPMAWGGSARETNITKFMPNFIMEHFPGLTLPEQDSAEKRRIMVELDKAYYRNKHGKEHAGYNWGRNEKVSIGVCVSLGMGFYYDIGAGLDPFEAYEEATSMVFPTRSL